MKLVCMLTLTFSLRETVCSFFLTRFWWFHLWHTKAIPCSRVLHRALALCLSLRSPLAFSDTPLPTLPKTVMFKHLCSELHLGLCIFSCFNREKRPCVYIFIFPIVVRQLQVELSYRQVPLPLLFLPPCCCSPLNGSNLWGSDAFVLLLCLTSLTLACSSACHTDA